MFTAKGHLSLHLHQSGSHWGLALVLPCCVNEDSRTCEQLQDKKLGDKKLWGESTKMFQINLRWSCYMYRTENNHMLRTFEYTERATERNWVTILFLLLLKKTSLSGHKSWSLSSSEPPNYYSSENKLVRF